MENAWNVDIRYEFLMSAYVLFTVLNGQRIFVHYYLCNGFSTVTRFWKMWHWIAEMDWAIGNDDSVEQ